ncbi:MAG: hypothetical protein H6581_14350 [Bacteroidia bacterium]|nr:hypothetical protein [Bacteroidia bacterium]
MKQLFFLPVLLTFLFQISLAQSPAYQLPARQQLAKSITPKEGFPIEADAFYPFAWSEEGQFAFFVLRNRHPEGEFPLFYLTDPQTGEFLFSWDGTPTEEKHFKTVEEAWKANSTLFSEIMAGYNIPVKGTPVFTKGSKFAAMDDEFSVGLELKLGERDGQPDPVTESIIVRLNKASGGKKVAFEFHHDNKNLTAPLNDTFSAKVLGAYVHPTLPRAVLIVEEIHPGAKGYYDSSYLVIGLNLEEGFE